MFKIYDGREHFYQWDLDRKLIVGDRTIQAVHFCNRTGACAITRDCYDVNGMWLVDVPNLCLQESYRLKVYGFSAAKYTTVSSQFDVKSRTKPDGYVYTDDEVNCWQDLDQRVAALEENPVEQEVIDTAIEAYFAANPIETGVGKAGTGEGAEIFNDYENNTATGKHTHAEGSYTHAIGSRSHAEGYYTQAIGHNSHAEGDVGIAQGNAAHAEGFHTEAIGEASHAEGKETIASGVAAHAEGKSYADGDYSHTEGRYTEAFGEASHAEGLGTAAFGDYQHVQGKFNLEDTEKKYAHIVGNGREPEGDGEWLRSNAHTLDWDGNAWFAGNVRVGGTCWDDATELGAGGGECAIEIVNATGDETIELDKTYDEIMAMVEAGKNVVINYDGNLYHQFNDRPIFRYVGDMETRQISFNPRDYSVRYSENIVPAYEDVGTIVEEMLEDRNFQTAEQVEAAINAAKPDLTGYAKTTDIPDVSAYQTAEQVNAAIVAYVGVIENGTY